MLINIFRTSHAGALDPGTTIVDPDPTAAGLHLYVDAITRTTEGVELACYPPSRREGKRWVRRQEQDDPVLEVADDATRERLLRELYRSLRNNPAVTIDARQGEHGSIVLAWPDGWCLHLEGVENPPESVDDGLPLVPDAVTDPQPEEAHA